MSDTCKMLHTSSSLDQAIPKIWRNTKKLHSCYLFIFSGVYMCSCTDHWVLLTPRASAGHSLLKHLIRFLVETILTVGNNRCWGDCWSLCCSAETWSHGCTWYDRAYGHDFQCILENLAPTNPQGAVDNDMTITPLPQRACLISIQKYNKSIFKNIVTHFVYLSEVTAVVTGS